MENPEWNRNSDYHGPLGPLLLVSCILQYVVKKTRPLRDMQKQADYLFSSLFADNSYLLLIYPSDCAFYVTSSEIICLD